MLLSDLLIKLRKHDPTMQIGECNIIMTDGEGTVVTITTPIELEEVDQ